MSSSPMRRVSTAVSPIWMSSNVRNAGTAVSLLCDPPPRFLPRERPGGAGAGLRALRRTRACSSPARFEENRQQVGDGLAPDHDLYVELAPETFVHEGDKAQRRHRVPVDLFQRLIPPNRPALGVRSLLDQHNSIVVGHKADPPRKVAATTVLPRSPRGNEHGHRRPRALNRRLTSPIRAATLSLNPWWPRRVG